VQPVERRDRRAEHGQHPHRVRAAVIDPVYHHQHADIEIDSLLHGIGHDESAIACIHILQLLRDVPQPHMLDILRTEPALAVIDHDEMLVRLGHITGPDGTGHADIGRGEGAPVVEAASRRPGRRPATFCRKLRISSAIFYEWKAKYGGLEVSDAGRLKALEDENAWLKKLLAEAMLDNAMLKDIASKKMVTAATKREAVAYPRNEFEVSERRACPRPG
jgi:hypothetical protein